MNDNDRLRAALWYASKRGWHVLPLHTPQPEGSCSCGDPDCDGIGKHPRIKKWNETATTDPAKIRAWWHKWPDANVGIACGLSRLVCVDLDVTPACNGPETWHDRYDLVYVELAMWEPVVDARRLLGERGLLGRCDPYMTLALKRLEQPGEAEAKRVEWSRVADELKRIHRLAHDEVTVIPLWEITDHFAYRRDVEGVVEDGASPVVSPYQYVEKWRIPFRYPGEP